MFTIPNQSSIPTAWKAFTSTSESQDPILQGRMKDSSNRDRVVDVCEELVKVTCILRSSQDLLADRYSERKERGEHGKLLTQKEKDDLAKQQTELKVSTISSSRMYGSQ